MDTDDPGMSELEREFELEMEEVEPGEAGEFEEGADEKVEEFADRFYELSTKSFESESEVDESVSNLMNEIEREYFFKGLFKKLKKTGKSLLKKGLRMAKGLPGGQVIKGITQVARGNLKGALGSVAKAGLSAAASAIPGGSIALQAVKGLGFEVAQEPDESREAWKNFVRVSREAYNYLAENLDENSDQPEEASRLSTDALKVGLRRGSRKPLPPRGAPMGKPRRIQIAKGDTVLIEGV